MTESQRSWLTLSALFTNRSHTLFIYISKYYNKVNANEKALFGDSNGLDSAVNNLKKNAHEKIKESDEKYWGKENTFADIFSIVLVVLFGVCAFVFIAIGIGSKFKGDTLKEV